MNKQVDVSRGFTMVELLIVIVIGALLAVVAIPSMRQVLNTMRAAFASRDSAGRGSQTFDLRIGQGLAATLADAPGREDLDHVGASRGRRAYPFADLLRRARGVAELRDRREDARSLGTASGDRRAAAR